MKKLIRANGTTMFLKARDGLIDKFLVKVEMSGISPMVALTDGLRLYKFGMDNNIYLDMFEVLEWFEKQLGMAEKDGCDHALLEDYGRSIRSCERIIDAYEKGEIELL